MVSPRSDLAPALLPGDLIARKYRVEQVLATGGMGVIYTAHHEALDQRVAVKVLRPSLANNLDAIERFQREARAAARLKTEHAIRVYDVDRLPNGCPFMVMEYLEGETLDKTLARCGRLPIPEAVDVMVQALSAIAEAHAVGIVHRDLKPGNIFVQYLPDGRRVTKVLDFGISKLTERQSLGGHGSGASITSSQALLGTPAYMAPEQLVSSRDVDGRSDIWSIGVILYELLTGRMLFASETAGSTFAKIINMPIPSLRLDRPEIPPALDEAVLRCLEHDPEERFASADELSAALMPFATDAVASLRSENTGRMQRAPSGAAAPRAPSTDLTFGRNRGSSRRSALPVVVPTVLAVALTVTLLWVLFMTPSNGSPDAATAPPAETADVPAPAPPQAEDNEIEADQTEADEAVPDETVQDETAASASASGSAPPVAAPPKPVPAPPPARGWTDGLGLDERK